MRGGYAMDKIKVLWMNNGEDGLQQYVELAKDYDLEITTCKCMIDFRHTFNDKYTRWDAVMINHKVKESPDLEAKFAGLYSAIDLVKNKKPFFVVTLSDIRNKAALMGVLTSNERYYNISNSSQELFNAIRIKVNNSPHNFVINKYSDVCRFCNHPSLISLLKKLEFGEDALQADEQIPNTCRSILEWLEQSLVFKKYGLSYKIISNKIETKKKEEMELYKTDKSFKLTIPPHLARSFHFCCEVTNEGSHEILSKKLIREGKAPYLNKSLIFNLLNVLKWCAELDIKTFEL